MIRHGVIVCKEQNFANMAKERFAKLSDFATCANMAVPQKVTHTSHATNVQQYLSRKQRDPERIQFPIEICLLQAKLEKSHRCSASFRKVTTKPRHTAYRELSS